MPPAGNNSNTFGREMARVIGKNADNVQGHPNFHPGATTPHPVEDPGYTPIPKEP